jgi:hypothetical protein
MIWQQHRGAFGIAGLAILVVLWYWFRPEKLFLNQRVNESAPATLIAQQPLFIGSLQREGAAGDTSGRVSVVKSGGGLELEISGLTSVAAKSFTVALAAPGNETHATELGPATSGAKVDLAIPRGIDPAVRKDVLLMDDSHHVLAKASLEAF